MYGWPSYEKSRFQEIDSHAVLAPATLRRTLPALAKYLGTPFNSELQKSRVIYTWITHNIIYDIDSSLKGQHYPSMEPKDVLLRGSAVSKGYAKLYKAFADKMGLQCVTISGYAKDPTWNGKIPSEINHDWNAVKVDDTWYFIDVTWGSGDVKGREFIRKFKNIYFLCPEDVFFYEHYPADTNWLPDIWKRKSPPVSLDTWSRLLRFEEEFLLLELSNSNFSQFESFSDYTTSDSVIDIFFQKRSKKCQALAFEYHLYKIDINNSIDIKTEVFNSVLIIDGNYTVHVSAALPDQGEYKLDIFGKIAESQMSYGKLVSLKIKNIGTGINKTCPKLYPSFYENKGTTIHSPLYGPLNDQKNIITEEIFFDFNLPGAINSAINPGWNYLTKSLLEEDRWNNNVAIQPGNTKLVVKYEEGERFQTIVEWK